MSKLAYLLLLLLRGNDADNALSAMSVKDIIEAEELGYKDNTIYKQLSLLAEQGYAKSGVKDGNANTYYITPEGINLLGGMEK